MSPPASQADVLLERKFHAGWGMGREETFLVVPHDEVCTCEHVQCTRTDWDVRFMAGWLSCTPSMTDLARGNPTRRQQFRSRSLCLGRQLGIFPPLPLVKSSPRWVAHNGSLLCSISICVHVWDAWQHNLVAGHNRIPVGPASDMPQPG